MPQWRNVKGDPVDPVNAGLVALDSTGDLCMLLKYDDAVRPRVCVSLLHGVSPGCSHTFVAQWIVQAWRGLPNEQRNVDRLLDVVRAGPYALWVQRLIITSTLRGR
jgi:hypothetical protein